MVRHHSSSSSSLLVVACQITVSTIHILALVTFDVIRCMNWQTQILPSEHYVFASCLPFQYYAPPTLCICSRMGMIPFGVRSESHESAKEWRSRFSGALNLSEGVFLQFGVMMRTKLKSKGWLSSERCRSHEPGSGLEVVNYMHTSQFQAALAYRRRCRLFMIFELIWTFKQGTQRACIPLATSSS